jgi:hypothetical protein
MAAYRSTAVRPSGPLGRCYQFAALSSIRQLKLKRLVKLSARVSKGHFNDSTSGLSSVPGSPELVEGGNISGRKRLSIQCEDLSKKVAQNKLCS